ncbi:DICT sensory domain-containing protein [Kamptonema formosum]|uniref:DICT sensory domain-containing protein n=1 Tax=Kamptonema formosum TaxID=331992 RepID=UPI000347280C|nr:DICT sensory domain-containing protein [Oscillatoria sp. PCC 10802]
MLKGSILQQLQAAHRTGKRPIRFGVYYKNTLVSLCHALEDCILTSSSSPIAIAAFQQGKWYLQEAERYGELAQKARQVVIMAAPDTSWREHPTSQLPNVDLVSLDATDPVAQEWHLMILSPTYTAMVLCQELEPASYGPAGPPPDDLERKFYGLWTFEPELVRETVELAIAHIGKYSPELQQTLTAQVEALTAEASASRRDDLGEIVCRVVDYLQANEHDLERGEQETPESSHPQALERNLVSNEIQAYLRMAQRMDMADATNPMAAAEVVALAEMIGQLLDLPAWQMKRLRLAGLLHRLEPWHGVQSVLATSSHHAAEAPSCPLVPEVQVLRRMPQLRAVAHILTHQTEWWDGRGQPAGLAGEEIPLESRILGLAADFQQRAAGYRSAGTLENPAVCAAQALAECQAAAGSRWDPKLADTLALLVMGLQQGLSLPVTSPKVTGAMWLLDFPTDSETKTGSSSTYTTSG